MSTKTKETSTVEAFAAHAAASGHGSSSGEGKPTIKEFRESPNCESRNGAIINRVVLHFTDTASLSSVLSWFSSSESSVSAHYVIAKNGDIYQMVRDGDKAWHCRGANASTIGIEHVAAKNEGLTAEQNSASIALVRWLCRAYSIPTANVTGHRYTPGYTGGTSGTDCPHSLFGPRTDQAIRDWVNANI